MCSACLLHVYRYCDVNDYYECASNRFYSTFTLETILAAAFGRIVDVQRGKADELKLASMKACDLKQDRMVMACIHLLSMLYSNSSSCCPVNCCLISLFSGYAMS